MGNPSVRVLLTCGALALLQGCSLGVTRFSEQYYLAVPSGKNSNYFRITVSGNSKLGKTTFRSGSFPADVVESLYGDTSKDGLAEAYKLQDDLKKKVNEALLRAWTAYLDVASNPKSSAAAVEENLVAIRRIRVGPSDAIDLPKGGIEMEYGPDQNLMLRNSGQKLVFVMSSNPDDIIKQISTFSNDVQTGATVLRLADLVQTHALGELAKLEASNESNTEQGVLLAGEIDNVIALTENDAATQDELVSAIEALRGVLEISR